MQRPLPITTPFLIGLTADVMLMDENEARHPDAALIPVKMKSGFTLYSYVDPSVAVTTPSLPDLSPFSAALYTHLSNNMCGSI